MSGHLLYIQPRMVKKGPFTVEAPGYEPVEGETIPRRIVAAKDKLVETPDEDTKTTFDIVRRGAKVFGNAKCVGARRLIKTHVENKKVKKVVNGVEEEVEKQWTYYELSGYSYLSYNEYEKLVIQLGAGLSNLGLTKGSRLMIYAATSLKWLSTAHGAASQSITIVTAYDTLGEDGLRHSMVQTKSEGIFLDPSLFPSLLNVLKAAGDAANIKYIIYNSDGEVKQEHLDRLASEYPNIKVLDWEALRKSGEENPVEPVPPTPEDLCCIMYTSGTTGPPKGVPLTHKNVIAAIAGVTVNVGPYVGPGDSLLAYLPLSHILEYVFENVTMYWGGTLGYGSPKTLSESSVRNCHGDIKEFRPTVMVGVPAVFETVRKGILAQVNKSSALARNLFWGALSAKEFLLSRGLPGSGVLDSVVFKKVKEATGGRLRILMNGGGPVAKDTLKFISYAIAPMISGYGLTETTAMGALQDPFAWNPNALGEPPASIEVKLVDFPEAGYTVKNKPFPQGEIWIRGASVTSGYYENEEETKAAITEDGWFKSGDIGEFDEHGHLRVIDRKKNLVKTLNGEYIALEKLESVYRASPVVANICVYAAEDQNKPVAIIVPAEPALLKLAAENGIKDEPVEKLIHNEKVKSLVLKELQNYGRQGRLKGIEIIDGVVLAEEEWNPQNGFTTAAQKLQRKKIVNKYRADIDRAYGKK
ncbi:hypothetical protein VTN49DRAFT_158 [Thermomyces lanuginosus]|uniref:uncharacterized protein n=1 Tax=Thermomyces lanuginosus TaxID=5541 RepID=UPI003743B904